MTHVSFYQLDGAPIDRVLPKLLEKAYTTGKKSLILSPSLPRIDHLDDALWTYDPEAFLPHGLSTEAKPSEQPILLSTTEFKDVTIPYAFILDGAQLEDVTRYERVFVLFDGNNADLLQSARTLWRSYKEHNHKLDYYTHTADKGWTKTASS